MRFLWPWQYQFSVKNIRLVDTVLDAYYKIQQISNTMIKVIFICLLLHLALSDCPLVPYPRQTVVGFISAQINNDPTLHGTPQQYSYALDQTLQEAGVSVAIGVIGLEINAHNQIDFYIEYLPSTQLNVLKFRAAVTDPESGWRSLRFSFIASQSFMFQTSMQAVNQFSTGIQDGKYSVYRPILNFNSFQVEPVIRIFMNGLQVKAKPLDEEYYQMAKQFQSFRKFSSNTQLVTYFGQAIQQKKAMSFRIVGGKILGRLLTFSIETNVQLKSLRFSYLLFSKKVLSQKNSYIIGDFYLINGNQYKFSSLQNMNMIATGLSGFKIPRDQLYQFTLTFESYFGQSYFDVVTNFKYFLLDFTFIALEMKQKYVCEDCTNSPLIYENRFCVEMCPRGYSKMRRLDNDYCQKCEMQKLKIVDTNTGDCVCAKRHYLDLVQDLCKPCNYDCMTCSLPDKCLTCDNNLLQTKRRLNSLGRCECPMYGFYDDKNSEDIVCQKCDSKCLTCNGPRAHDCLSCTVGKQLDPFGFCRCKNGYYEDSAGNCVCNPPRVLFNNFCLDTQAVCSQNQVQQYVQVSRRCICKPGFISIGDDCIRCGINAIFDQQQLRCKCSNRTVLINGDCVTCGYNQVYDDFSQICVCRSGTYKTDEGNCITCPTKMTYINSRCQCIFNYYQSRPGTCQRCLRETDGPKCRRNTY